MDDQFDVISQITEHVHITSFDSTNDITVLKTFASKHNIGCIIDVTHPTENLQRIKTVLAFLQSKNILIHSLPVLDKDEAMIIPLATKADEIINKVIS